MASSVPDDWSTSSIAPDITPGAGEVARAGRVDEPACWWSECVMTARVPPSHNSSAAVIDVVVVIRFR